MVGVAQKIMSLNYDDIRPPCFIAISIAPNVELLI